MLQDVLLAGLYIIDHVSADLGTATYNSGLKWFVEEYKKRGVVFDEIWVGAAPCSIPPTANIHAGN